MARVPPLWEHWLDGIHPELQLRATHVAQGIRLHDYAAALNSSMAFGLNLLLPFADRHEPLAAVLSSLCGEPFVVDRLDFEWAPPAHVLGELHGDSPGENEPFTAIDVLVSGRAGGRRAGALFEVKLTEGVFTPCKGRGSRANRRDDVCRSAAVFVQDPRACYLTRPWRAVRDRRYWEIFAAAHGSVAAAFPGIDASRECPFSGNSQQIMRQHAAALGSVQAGMFERAWIVLVHHDDNPDVPGPWDAYVEATTDRELFRRLPASKLLAAGHPFARWMAERYQLGAEAT